MIRSVQVTHATTLVCALMAVAIGLATGCASAPPKTQKKGVSRAKPDPSDLFADEDMAPEATADVTKPAGSGGQAAKAKPKWSVPGAPQTQEQSAKASPPDESLSTDPADAPEPKEAKKQDDRRWSVCLLSFTGEGHEQLAKAACSQVRGKYPALSGAFVRSKSNGSVVLVGRFSAPGDPEAKPLLDQVHAMTDGSVRPFARAMLTRWEPARAGKVGQFDLRQARLANPDQRTMYSMEVAVWSDFESGELSLEEIRKRAEAYTAKLRAQGYLAFYNHDDDRRMSIVTIGIFGHDAYNSQSMLFSDEVEAIRKKFPKLLVNGEELQRIVRSGSQETTPEKTFLIEVPR